MIGGSRRGGGDGVSVGEIEGEAVVAPFAVDGEGLHDIQGEGEDGRGVGGDGGN